MRDLLNYLQRHWRGEFSLACSFWLNLIAVRVGVTCMQALWMGEDGDRRGMPLLPVIIALLLVHGGLFLWQAVGVLRASERHAIEYGARSMATGAQLVVILLLVLTLADALEAYQTTLAAPPEESFAEQMDRERAERYRLVLMDSASTLLLDGQVTHGVTARVRKILSLHGDVKQVVLSSKGGNVFEARGLANLFRQRKLDTHVETSCASACTIAFMGGSKRSLKQGAQLGFHGYRMNAGHDVVVTNAAREQERDRALFLDAGVAPDFVARMFDATPEQMWWPTHDKLLGAGVVHAAVR